MVTASADLSLQINDYAKKMWTVDFCLGFEHDKRQIHKLNMPHYTKTIQTKCIQMQRIRKRRRRSGNHITIVYACVSREFESRHSNAML